MRLLEGTPWDRPPRCEKCGALETECQCPPELAARISPEKQTARLALEKRQKGKMVTVVRGLAPEGSDLSALLSKLKTACGAGGTLKEDAIEIQGKQLDRVRDTLMSMGYKVKG
ncbi:MAG: translation initiation factor [Planctomycetota bacterium]